MEALAERIRRIESGGPGPARVQERPALRFPDCRDGVALAAGRLHEWVLDDGGPEHGRWWAAPLTLLIHLARAAARASGGDRVFWIGRRCWPYPPALAGGEEHEQRLLRCSVFVDPPDAGARLWAIDLALRSGAAAAVVADAGGLDMAASRRLQLAAEAGAARGGALSLGLLARPPWEVKALSAASTRWAARLAPSPNAAPRWTVELLRCKGVRPGHQPRMWLLERSHAQGVVAVSAQVGDGSGQTSPGAHGSARITA